MRSRARCGAARSVVAAVFLVVVIVDAKPAAVSVDDLPAEWLAVAGAVARVARRDGLPGAGTAVARATASKGAAVVDELQRRFVPGHTGFHRSVETKVTAMWPPGAAATGTVECTMFLVELLPPGLYADADELTRHGSTGAGGTLAAPPTGGGGVELPAFKANASTVAVGTPVTLSAGTWMRVRASATFETSLHARYPATGPDDVAVEVLPPPAVFLSCGGAVPNVAPCPRHVCSRASLEWRVPAGTPAHATPVTLATASATVAGALAIGAASRLVARQ